MPLTVTVYTELLTGVTCVRVEVTVPVVAGWKSVASTPMTGSLKVIVKLTALALVNRLGGLDGVIDRTCRFAPRH
jgi:hypothetical protein